MALGKAKVNIVANLAPLKRGLISARAAVTRFVKISGAAMKTGFSAGFRIISRGLRNIVSLSKLAAAAILGIVIASVKVRSDVQETENLFTISMGKMADKAAVWVEEYSRSLGLFESDTKKALGTFQLMLTSMGIGEKQSFAMAKGLTELTNDIASFRNLKPAEVFLKLTGAITGETEGLKRIGILVNENIIKKMALTDATIQERIASEKTIPVMKKYGNLWVDVAKKTKKQTLVLTDAEKVMLRYKAIVERTTRDQGDMARTLDDTANVFRTVWSQVKVTANTIGDVFIPAITKAGIAVRDFFIDNQPMIKKWAGVVNDAVLKAVGVLRGFFDLANKGDFEGLGKAIGDLLTKMGTGLKDFFGRFAPVAVNVGTLIGKGFWQSLENTPFGRLLGNISKVGGAVGTVVRVATQPARNTATLLGGIAGRLAGRVVSNQAEFRQREMLEERKRFRDAGSIQIVEQLKILNKNVLDDRGF